MMGRMVSRHNARDFLGTLSQRESYEFELPNLKLKPVHAADLVRLVHNIGQILPPGTSKVLLVLFVGIVFG